MKHTEANTVLDGRNQRQARADEDIAIIDENFDDLKEFVDEVNQPTSDRNARTNGHFKTESAIQLETEPGGTAIGKQNSTLFEEPKNLEPNSCLSSESGSYCPQPLPTVARANDLPSKDKLHLFSPKIARWVGVAAATVFHYIRWHCLYHGKYSGTYKDLLKVFPYLTHKQLQMIISKLTDSHQFAPLLIRSRIRGQNRFAYELEDGTMKLKKLHCFDPQFALKHDVNMAVIYDDIVRWISANAEDDSEKPYHYESPAQWARVHRYMPLRTVERCFARLARANELIQIGKIARLSAKLAEKDATTMR